MQSAVKSDRIVLFAALCMNGLPREMYRPYSEMTGVGLLLSTLVYSQSRLF